MIELILGALILFLLLADQIWTWRKPISPRLYLPSTRLGWTLTPRIEKQVELRHKGALVYQNTIRINSHGFNEREWGEKQPGRNRVLVMGDSIIESRQVPVKQNFVARAEQLLNTDHAPQYELFNIGVAGWSVDSVLNYLQHFGRRLEPDLVVLGLFTGNDLVEGDYQTFRYLFAYAWDCRRYDKPAFSLKDGKLSRSNYPAWRNVIGRFLSVDLYTHSRTFRFGYQRFNRVMAQRYNGSNLLRAAGISYNMHMEQTKGNEFFYTQSEAQVDALAAECRTLGAKFGILLEPNFPLFYPLTETDPTSRAYREYQCDLKHYREMQQRLSKKYPLLSLIEPLHSAGQTITFKPGDPHFNLAGHELVAGQLADLIRRV
ncbi:MAG: SGNH/GDSL hydrolase family protein [Chloroflexi bacterium]|nr:SGNH/GDSL hydrolase family protein [Chloroflexota bacterium]